MSVDRKEVMRRVSECIGCLAMAAGERGLMKSAVLCMYEPEIPEALKQLRQCHKEDL